MTPGPRRASPLPAARGSIAEPPREEFPPLTQSDPTGFSPPPSFGPFRVLHQIGTGVLGPVFRTYEPARDRLVAVKAFRLDLTPEQGYALAEDLQRVAHAGLDHPSIVRPVAAGVEGTIPYAGTEYVAGESLDIALRHYAPAGLDMVLPFITQLAAAIDFARAAGIGHGALHPRDIFVTPYEARATGFGVVQALERIGLRAPVRRPYTAPERVEGGEWDTSADVYSLAAIAFELLTGRRPVGSAVESLGPNAGDHAESIAKALSRALSDSPADRFSTALAFAAALEASSRGERTTTAIEQVSAVAGAPLAAAKEPETVSGGPRHELTVERDDETADIDAEREADLAEIQLRRDDEAARETDSGDPHRHLQIAPLPPVAAREPERPYSRIEEPPEESVQEPPIEAVQPPVSDFDAPVRESRDQRSSLFDLDVESESIVPEVEHPDFVGGSDARRWEFDESETPAREGAETEPVVEADRPPAFLRRDREPDQPRGGVGPTRRARPVLLPIAVTLLLGLFVGFLAGYLVGARDTGDAAATASATLGREAGDTGAGTGSPGAARQGASPQADRSPRASSARPATTESSPAAVRDAATPPARTSPPASPPARGRLMVRSNPPGAQVYLNGRRRGSTPLALRDLAPGTYTVRVSRSGYQDVSRRISVGGGGVRDVTLRLTRRAAAASAPTRGRQVYTGGLYVDSRPRGARVFLDGKPVGATPMQLGEVRAGAHVVRLELPDHRTWTSSTRVVAGETVRVTGSLERIR